MKLSTNLPWVGHTSRPAGVGRPRHGGRHCKILLFPRVGTLFFPLSRSFSVSYFFPSLSCPFFFFSKKKRLHVHSSPSKLKARREREEGEAY